MASMNPPTLRKRAPFWCRAKDASGKYIHLDHALGEDEGDMCKAHQQEHAEVVRRFFETPVRPPRPPVIELDAAAACPIWPV